MADTFASPSGIFVIDDTSFPKQGKHLRRRAASVLRGAGQEGQLPGRPLGPLRRARKGHYPLAMRLYLPEKWLEDAKRLDKAGVPEQDRRPLTKGQIALELLDTGAGRRVCPADSWWPTPATGSPGPFRDGAGRSGACITSSA